MMAWGTGTCLLNETGQTNSDAVFQGLMTFAKTLKRLVMLKNYW